MVNPSPEVSAPAPPPSWSAAPQLSHIREKKGLRFRAESAPSISVHAGEDVELLQKELEHVVKTFKTRRGAGGEQGLPLGICSTPGMFDAGDVRHVHSKMDRVAAHVTPQNPHRHEIQYL